MNKKDLATHKKDDLVTLVLAIDEVNADLDNEVKKVKQEVVNKATELSSVKKDLAWIKELTDITSETKSFQGMNETQINATLVKRQRVLKYAINKVNV